MSLFAAIRIYLYMLRLHTERTGATQLRDAASGGAAGDAADGEEGAAAAPSGGVAGMLKAGLAKATSVASQGASAVLGTVADGLDAAVCKIEQPFTEVGARPSLTHLLFLTSCLMMHISFITCRFFSQLFRPIRCGGGSVRRVAFSVQTIAPPRSTLVAPMARMRDVHQRAN